MVDSHVERQSAREVEAQIKALQDLEAQTRKQLAQLVANAPPNTLLDALDASVRQGLALTEDDEAAIALTPLIAILGELKGARICDLLIDIVGSSCAEVRWGAVESLEDLASERLREVLEATERALSRLPEQHHALKELPYVFSEVSGEPGVSKVLGQFFKHKNPEVVASAIEAAVELGESSLLPDLQRLKSDKRNVQLPDDETQSSIGLLASEAIHLLRELADADKGRPR